MHRLLQSIGDEARMRRGADTPGDDLAGTGLDDGAMGTPLVRETMARGDMDEALPCGDTGEIADPEHVGRRNAERAVHLVQRARGLLVRDRLPVRLAADDALNGHVLHEPATVQAMRHRILPGRVAARPCERRRPASFLRKHAGSRAAGLHRGGRGPTGEPDQPAFHARNGTNPTKGNPPVLLLGSEEENRASESGLNTARYSASRSCAIVGHASYPDSRVGLHSCCKPCTHASALRKRRRPAFLPAFIPFASRRFRRWLRGSCWRHPCRIRRFSGRTAGPALPRGSSR